MSNINTDELLIILYMLFRYKVIDWSNITVLSRHGDVLLFLERVQNLVHADITERK